jgi:hypothetical protein
MGGPASCETGMIHAQKRHDPGLLQGRSCRYRPFTDAQLIEIIERKRTSRGQRYEGYPAPFSGAC